MIKIGLLGCGRIGQVHAKSIHLNEHAKLVAVADVFAEAAEKLAAEYDADVRSAETICTSSDVDAVLIGTPTDTHIHYILLATNAGKSVLCEKPFDLDSQRIMNCIAELKDDATLMFGFQRRFDPHFAALKSQIDAGSIGNVEMINLTSRDPSPPPLAYIERSGGIFADMAIHDFDMARFLLGEEPTMVQAVGAALVNPEIGEAGDFDSVAIQLQTASGRICQISCSRRASYGYDQRVEVHGSNGMLQAQNMHQNTVMLADAHGFKQAPLMDFFLERYLPAYQNELNAFIDVVRGQSTASPSSEDALKAQLLAEAALQSCKSGSVVTL